MLRFFKVRLRVGCQIGVRDDDLDLRGLEELEECWKLKKVYLSLPALARHGYVTCICMKSANKNSLSNNVAANCYQCVRSFSIRVGVMMT